MQYIKNEWIKMWSQKNAWIMLVILIGLLALVSGINKYYDTDSSTSEARQEANENRIINNNEMLTRDDFSEEDKLYWKKQKEEYQKYDSKEFIYELDDNNIKYQTIEKKLNELDIDKKIEFLNKITNNKNKNRFCIKE